MYKEQGLLIVVLKWSEFWVRGQLFHVLFGWTLNNDEPCYWRLQVHDIFWVHLKMIVELGTYNVNCNLG